jgi:hypothetical protein
MLLSLINATALSLHLKPGGKTSLKEVLVLLLAMAQVKEKLSDMII